MQGGNPVTLLHRGGGDLVSPLSCSSQRYSNLSLIWSEMAFSTVLACRVGILWHSYTGGGGTWCPPCLVQVNGTLIFHWYGRKWLLARCWHAGWESCDTPTPGGGDLVSPLSCSSQRYSNLSLIWSEMAFSTVLACRVGILWHSYTGGGGTWCPPCLVQVNGTLIFHWYGRKWLLARCWHAGWESCDTPTPGGGDLVSPLSCSSQRYSNLSLIWSEMAFSTVLACRVGILWHSYTGGGGDLVSPLSCSSQRYSNLSLIWSEMAFSTVLACRVGILWHSYTGGGGPGVPPVLFKSTVL